MEDIQPIIPINPISISSDWVVRPRLRGRGIPEPRAACVLLWVSFDWLRTGSRATPRPTVASILRNPLTRRTPAAAFGGWRVYIIHRTVCLRNASEDIRIDSARNCPSVDLPVP